MNVRVKELKSREFKSWRRWIRAFFCLSVVWSVLTDEGRSMADSGDGWTASAGPTGAESTLAAFAHLKIVTSTGFTRTLGTDFISTPVNDSAISALGGRRAVVDGATRSTFTRLKKEKKTEERSHNVSNEELHLVVVVFVFVGVIAFQWLYGVAVNVEVRDWMLLLFLMLKW